MLVLTFRVAEVLYGLAVKRVVEVVPRVDLRGCPTPRAISRGCCGIEGAVPVVDLGLLMVGRACEDRLDTRIILVDAGPPRRVRAGLPRPDRRAG